MQKKLKQAREPFDKQCDIQTLFIYRYLLDKEEPVHSLEKDLEDLDYFPERIEGSYRAEWYRYVKRRLHELSLKSPEEQTAFWQTLESNMTHPERDKALQARLEKIQKSVQIAQDDKISVIKTPLKTYIEQLIKY